jgi:hypothetical protein
VWPALSSHAFCFELCYPTISVVMSALLIPVATVMRATVPKCQIQILVPHAVL